MEEKQYCYRYPHPAVTTDCVVFGMDGEKLKVLLIERGNEPFKGLWAFPGGFLNPDETSRQGALRELEEETGLKGVDIRQFHTFADPNRDPRDRVISIAYFTLIEIRNVKANDDAAKAKWFEVGKIPPLAFDHEKMMRIALARLRQSLYISAIGYQVLPSNFSLGELKAVYETIVGSRIEDEFFISGLKRSGLLVKVGEGSYCFNKSFLSEDF